MEIPSADHILGVTNLAGNETRGSSRFRNREAPSKHSGLSSLSPKEPSSSLIRMSTFSGTSSVRISPNRSLTFSSPHSSRWRSWRLGTNHIRTGSVGAWRS